MYNTGNPVPSAALEDMADNAQTFDALVTKTDGTTTDRKGVNRRVFQQIIMDMGFQPLAGSFQTGATITARNQALYDEVSHVFYAWGGVIPVGGYVVPVGSTPTTAGGVGVAAWSDKTDLTLRAELASSAPGKGVDLVYGAAKQTKVDALQVRSDSFAYIEDYASLVVSGDWTAAIQAAFDTGKTVIGKQGKTYKTTAIINSNGQPFIGRLSLQLARASIPSATFDVEYSKPSEHRYFRGIYVQSAYDLCELLRIKSMGFNTILHYCYFGNNGSVDIAGTIPQLIKNAATAGLNVVINTQNSVAHNNGTVAQVVAAADPYQNVIGYSVIDEPGSAGHSLAEQEAAISTLRALTTKKLFSVDFIWRLNTWSKPWSYNYDVFLVDSYSMYYASGTLADRVNKDLGKMRTDFGAAMKMTGNAKVIPCIQTFAQLEQNPVEGISGTYCFDVDQACAASKVFGRAGNGDFACFVWDASFPSNLANNVKFQSMIAELMQHAGSGEVYKTEPIIFGGVGSVYQRSLHDILAVTARKDPENSTDGWLGGGAWPVRLITGASETPIRTTTAGINIAGIGFRNVFSRLVTTKSLLKYFTGFAVFENYSPVLTGPASFNVYSTNDGGYTETIRYNTGVTAGNPFRFSSLMTNSYDGIGEDAVFDLSVATVDAQANYRRFVYGLFVSTNW